MLCHLILLLHPTPTIQIYQLQKVRIIRSVLATIERLKLVGWGEGGGVDKFIYLYVYLILKECSFYQPLDNFANKHASTFLNQLEIPCNPIQNFVLLRLVLARSIQGTCTVGRGATP